MKWKFWEKQSVATDLNDMELKVLSRYLINQRDIISGLSEQNQQLTAEVQVLRETLDILNSINTKNADINTRVRLAKRSTSPFRKK
jgi:regulator of replication initiation timing